MLLGAMQLFPAEAADQTPLRPQQNRNRGIDGNEYSKGVASVEKSPDAIQRAL